MTKTEIVYGLMIVILGAPGFWQYAIDPIISRFRKKAPPQDRALIGLLHERILDEHEHYKKQWTETGNGISRARYEYIETHILQPYLDLGGNSDATKLVNELKEFIDER